MSTFPSSSFDLPSESSPASISISPRLSWFHQTPSGDVEFSPNASFSLAPRGLVFVDFTRLPDRKPEEDLGATHSFLEGTEREGMPVPVPVGEALGTNGMAHPNSYKVIRSRPIRSLRSHHRAFQHRDPDNYSHLSLQTSHSEELPFELPLPTSQTTTIRPRRFRLRRTWLIAFDSTCSRRLGPAFFLSLYFGFNLGLTLYNKSLLIHFPFPYTLSAIHALCSSIGSTALIRAGSPPPPKLNLRETLILLAFSALYTVNIIISNVSLGLVTVPVCPFSVSLIFLDLRTSKFHQVVRASTPLFTILFSSIIFGTQSSRAKLVALVPVIAGVGFACVEQQYSD